MTVELTPPRILIADEDTSIQQTLSDYCKGKQWVCDIVCDSASALKAANNNHYDVIIVDTVMPGDNGLSLLKNLRQKQPAQAIIAVRSAGATTDLDGPVGSCAPLEFLDKPLSITSLESSLKKVIPQTCSVAAQNVQELEFNNNYEFHSFDLADAPPFHFEELNQLVEAGVIDNNTRLRLELVCQEALCNSVEHGNLELKSEWREVVDQEGLDQFSKIKGERLEDPHFADRLVKLKISFINRVLEIVFKDQGPGFQVNSESADSTGEDDIQVHGRGLSIMKGIMDEVIYNDGGRELVLRKRL